MCYLAAFCLISKTTWLLECGDMANLGDEILGGAVSRLLLTALC